MGKNFRETLNERMQDPAFRTEWDVQEPERQIMRANPSLRTLKRLAAGMGMALKLEFVPTQTQI